LLIIFHWTKTEEMMQELLEPEEYENFTQLIGNPDGSRDEQSVARGGSATQPLRATEKMLQGEVGGLGDCRRKACNRYGAARLAGLRRVQVFDETLASGSRAKQMESYYEALVGGVVRPERGRHIIGDAYKYFSRLGYTAGQGVARGVREGVDAVHGRQ
jgi:hypothetical protein